MGWADALRNSVDAFYRSIADESWRTSPQPYASFEDGFRGMAFVEACVRSSKERRWVKVETTVNESKKQYSSLFIGIGAAFVSFLFASEAMFFFVNRHYSSPSPLATGRKACRRAAAILSQPAYHHTKPASRGTCRATAVKPRPTLMLLYAPARSDGCRALALPCQKAGGKGKKKIVAATVAVRVQKLACCV